MSEPQLESAAIRIPFFVPRFWLLVLHTTRMKFVHRVRGRETYSDHLRKFYTRSQTNHVESYGDAYAAVRDRVVAKASLAPGDTVIDAATGGGYQAAAFARTGHPVVGLDIVLDRVRLASEQHGRDIAWGVSDISRLPIVTDAADILTVSLALHDMPHDTRVGALSELRRVARKRIVILEPRAPHVPIWRHIFAAVCELVDESLHIWDFTLHDFEGCLHEAGLHIISAERMYHGILVCYVLEPDGA